VSQAVRVVVSSAAANRPGSKERFMKQKMKWSGWQANAAER
jgi:hypothetical protein